MKCSMRLGVLALGFVLATSLALRADEASLSSKSAKVEAPQGELVELFAGAAKGDIEVKLILKDSTTGQVIITNKTKKPLTIQLPEAFAGVPVLAQGFGGGGLGGGGGNNNNNNQNQNQGVGGGMMGGMGGGMGGGGFGGGGGGGLFNVAPEKAGKLKVTIVCLEHGKVDPNPRVNYQLRPLESFTSKPEVIEVVKMLSKGEIDQHSAQAAAWHLANDMSWSELANKVGKKHLNGSVEPYFTAGHLELGVRATREAAHRAEEFAKKHPTSKAGKSLADK
jgi:hypothetical protein